MKLLIAIPAYNEEKIIRENIIKLYQYLQSHCSQYTFTIVVSDNGSTDATKHIIVDLSQSMPEVKYMLVEQKGKGIAIRSAWSEFEADIYCFMDADLAVDLEALPGLIAAIADEKFDIACGSRYHKDSQVNRTFARKIISFGYRILLKIVFQLRVKDAPCGFKAINQKIKAEVLPKVKNSEWFFDSELVILAEKLGYKIKEVPVRWEEKQEKGRKSRVNVFSLALEYIKKALELKKRLDKKIM